ncbi:MAG: hypothetical protein DRP85_09380 [Candidatus Makaraimicrobium thalassicum]|nr:MAG: hypothetical protein DRP85_09380 [Candidatus Omnitrophota bacterium]
MPQYLETREFRHEVAKGTVSGALNVRALGERESMQVVVQGEDISRLNELSPTPTNTTTIPVPASTGEQFTVVSEGDEDTGNGTGVRTLRLHIIRLSDGKERTEDITMNGTTEVDTVITDGVFINDMYALSVGSNGVAVDHIKVYKKGEVGTVYNMIAKGGNKSMIPNRMVPAGKTLILRGWHAEEAKGKRVAMRIRSTDMHGELIEGVFCFKDVAYINKAATGDLHLNIPIPSFSIIKVSGWADVAGAETSCGWYGILEDTP